jgi:hypothetical protein
MAFPLPTAVCAAFPQRKEIVRYWVWKIEVKTIQLSMIEFSYHSTYYLKL